MANDRPVPLDEWLRFYKDFWNARLDKLASLLQAEKQNAKAADK